MNEPVNHQTAVINGYKAELRDPKPTPWDDIHAELVILYQSESGEAVETSCGKVDPLDPQQVHRGLLVADQAGVPLEQTLLLISNITQLASQLKQQQKVKNVSVVVEESRRDCRNQSDSTCTTTAASVWDQRVSLKDFLAEEIQVVDELVADLVIPGGITTLSAPSSTCKSVMVYILANALASGGVFREQRLQKARVLLIDYDNPRSTVQKRLRQICADHDVTFEIMGRGDAPQLLDRAAWDAMPAEEFDVVIIDSFGSATVGISEKEGAKLQVALAALAPIADRGPAVIVLENTNKAGSAFDGRVTKLNRVDVLYEVRDITGWIPPKGDAWWKYMPSGDVADWQERAARNAGQTKRRIALINRKYRDGEEPEPFALQIDFAATPWSVSDVTFDVEMAGREASAAEKAAQQQKLKDAAAALVEEINRRGDDVMSKADAEDFLRTSCGLKRNVSRSILEAHDDITNPGKGAWRLLAISGKHGTKIGVFPLCDNNGGEKGENGNTNKINGRNMPVSRRAPAISTARNSTSDTRINTRDAEPTFLAAEKKHTHENGVCQHENTRMQIDNLVCNDCGKVVY